MSKVTQRKTVSFKHVSKDVLKKVQESGILPKPRPFADDVQFEVTMATLLGQPVLSHSVEYGSSLIGDGTLASAIKSLSEMATEHGFVGGPENVQVIHDERYNWGDLEKFTLLVGWREMTPKQVAQFKEFRKVADQAQKVADQAEAAELVKRAAAQQAYAAELLAKAETLKK